ncbi:monomeric sarcosine oxidase-like [Ruditapes philippinarum]|uniref:monomeric sarcosine oxidase-like n=1 Tax=Ruditapes philippinarum TaxID=129788 RepID=UPI00295BCBAB|nr:monomeric sarcosine oxidase-like [Ruditapes philippinarum]
MDRKVYDYIVVGCGGIGSAALYWLSKRAGSGVLGIEQFELGHHNGGSQDHSRIIRMAYHDDIYTKLTPETYKAFAVAEEESGIQLVYKTGGLLLAKKGETDHLAKKYADAMATHNIPYEWLSGRQLRARYPQFTTDDKYVAVYQKDGGLVDAAMTNAVHIQLARGKGASVVENCPVLNLARNENGTITINTPKSEFICKKVVVTSGAWINHVVGSVGVHVPIYVTQEQVTYLATSHMKEYVKDKFPIFIYHSTKHDIYGMPIHGNSGFKIGVDAGGPFVTAESRTFTPDPVRENNCIDFLKEVLPTSVGPILYSKTCLYTMPPDRNFIIDTCHRTGFDDVIVCNGAGHAYKFAGLLGKILGEMAIDGKTQYDISPFTLDREALKDPDYKPVFFMGTGNKLPGGGEKKDKAKL